MDKLAADTGARAADELRALARFTGAPGEFWRRFLEGAASLGGAERAVLLFRREGGWAPGPRVGQGLAEGLSTEELEGWLEETPPGAAYTLQELENGATALFAPLRQEDEARSAAAVIVLEAPEENGLAEKVALILEVPAHFEQRRLAEASRKDASRMANALDLMAQLNGHAKFTGAAMALCNELAARFSCARVSVGWIEANYVAVKAMSHTEKIEPKMEAVQQLAAAMEECCDQAEEILHPRPEGQAFVTRDHKNYAKAREIAAAASLPLFDPVPDRQKEGEPPAVLGAVTLERAETPFTLEELTTIRLMLDQASRPLAELHGREGWFAKRWAAAAREKAAKLLGPEHTWWKLLAVSLAVALLVLIFGHTEYRVEGTFALKTDATAYLSAPFEGHIELAAAKPGDKVAAGQELIGLDRRELLLQRGAAIAERQRHAADALKAESTGDMAGMRVAQARLEQANAQIAIIDDRLAQARIKAPFDGVVAEGDLREKIGAPVQKGDVLIKVARIEDLYLVVEVPERDIQDIREGAKGQAAFASLPARKFALVVEKIEPVARSKEQGNLFTVQCRFTEPPEDWWRPGMSGIAKMDAGRKSFLWICTHRTMDFLRLWWW
jgi:RND family efflux transporter MFP subunit